MTTAQSTIMSACAVVRSRLFVFGGNIGDSGTSSTKPSNGVYSIDLDRTLATGNPSDLQSHGVLDASLAGTLNQAALVQSGPRVLLAGGSGRRPDALNAPLDTMYLYDVAKGTTSVQAAKIQVALNASVPAAAAISEGMSDLYFFGGVKDAAASTPLNWLAVVRSDGTTGNSNVTAGPDPRELATLGRFNRTHNLMTGGVGINDQWLLELKSLAWTRLPAAMARGRVHHRTVVYRSRYLIHVGGASTPRSYELVEYTDMKTAGSARIGKLVNPSNGPTSLAYGCAHLEDDVIVYVGGWVFESGLQKASTGALESFLNLLQILPQTDGTLQFKWVTGVPASNGTSTRSTDRPSTTLSRAGSESGSGGLGAGAIAGIVVGAVAVAAGAAVLYFARKRRLQKGHSDVPPLFVDESNQKPPLLPQGDPLVSAESRPDPLYLPPSRPAAARPVGEEDHAPLYLA